MPALARITATFFTRLIDRLGIRPPFGEGWEMSNVVQPISIVDSDVTLSAVTSTMTLDTPSTGGELAAPLAGATLADTGALTANTYNFALVIGCDGTAGIDRSIRIKRRNAADTADIWSALVTVGSGSSPTMISFRATISLNERVRITVGPNNFSGTVQACIWAVAG